MIVTPENNGMVCVLPLLGSRLLTVHRLTSTTNRPSRMIPHPMTLVYLVRVSVFLVCHNDLVHIWHRQFPCGTPAIRCNRGTRAPDHHRSRLWHRTTEHIPVHGRAHSIFTAGPSPDGLHASWDA